MSSLLSPLRAALLSLALTVSACDNDASRCAPCTCDAGEQDAGDGSVDRDGGTPLPCETALAFDVIQLGTAAADEAVALGIDARCNVFVAGATSGPLGAGGSSLPGAGKDAFLRRISLDASQDFTVQQGSDLDEDVSGLALAPAGDVVVVGTTYGQMPGAPAQYGGVDVFALSFTDTGTRRFVSQYGSFENDFGTAVVVRPDGDVLVAGATLENLVVSLELSVDVLHGQTGAVRERARYGSELADRAEGIALGEDGTLHVVGSTLGEVGAPPLGSFDFLLLSRGPRVTNGPRFYQRSTRDIDAALDVAVDREGNLYVAAISYSDLVTGAFENDGIRSGFLVKVSPTGHVLWVRRVGGVAYNGGVEAVAVGPDGHVYVAGRTEGDLFSTNAGDMDAFVARYEPDGTPLGGRQIGTASEDVALDVAVTGLCEVVIVGRTGGALAGEGSALGGMDAFVARFACDSFGTLPE